MLFNYVVRSIISRDPYFLVIYVNYRYYECDNIAFDNAKSVSFDCIMLHCKSLVERKLKMKKLAVLLLTVIFHKWILRSR